MRKCATRFKWRLGGKKRNGARFDIRRLSRERERDSVIFAFLRRPCVYYMPCPCEVCAPGLPLIHGRQFLRPAVFCCQPLSDTALLMTVTISLSLSAVCVCVEREIDFWPPFPHCPLSYQTSPISLLSTFLWHKQNKKGQERKNKKTFLNDPGRDGGGHIVCAAVEEMRNK